MESFPLQVLKHAYRVNSPFENTFHNRWMCATARPQRTSFSSTYDHPAPFVKRPALAPMYTALCLTSSDQVNLQSEAALLGT
jgi:hypothetical protein